MAVVRHRQIGTAIDEESHSVLIPLNRRFVKNARRRVRRPVGVDVGAALQEKRRDLEVPIQNRPRERDAKNLLSRRRSPMQVNDNRKPAGRGRDLRTLLVTPRFDRAFVTSEYDRRRNLGVLTR
jgi:hypothetical protein